MESAEDQSSQKSIVTSQEDAAGGDPNNSAADQGGDNINDNTPLGKIIVHTSNGTYL